MKKIAFVPVVVVLLIICAAFKTDSRTKKNENRIRKTNLKKKKIATTKYTLNGYKFDEADLMVSNFIKDSTDTKTDKRTCVWFSLDALKQMETLIDETKDGDGFRLYFAKDKSDPTKNNLIAVLTTSVDDNSAGAKKHIHLDYFLDDDPASGDNTINMNGVPGLTSGAKLFNAVSPCSDKGTCINPHADKIEIRHQIPCSDAYQMVSSPLKGKFTATSEWFDFVLLHNLIYTLDTQNGDGIRIYYAMSLKPDATNTKRHGFVITTTKANTTDLNLHEDYFNCILDAPRKTYNPGLRKRKDIIDKDYPEANKMFGADNGEQCPFNCKGITWQ